MRMSKNPLYFGYLKHKNKYYKSNNNIEGQYFWDKKLKDKKRLKEYLDEMGTDEKIEEYQEEIVKMKSVCDIEAVYQGHFSFRDYYKK